MSYSPEMVTMFIPLMKDLNLSWAEIKATPRYELHGLATALSEFNIEFEVRQRSKKIKYDVNEY